MIENEMLNVSFLPAHSLVVLMYLKKSTSKKLSFNTVEGHKSFSTLYIIYRHVH